MDQLLACSAVVTLTNLLVMRLNALCQATTLDLNEPIFVEMPSINGHSILEPTRYRNYYSEFFSCYAELYPQSGNERSRRESLVGQRAPYTCQWLMISSEVERWSSYDAWRFHESILWVVGKPGRGKSVLCAALLDFLEGPTSYKTSSCSRDTAICWSFQELILGESQANHLLVVWLEQLIRTAKDWDWKIDLSYMLQSMLLSGEALTQTTFAAYLTGLLKSSPDQISVIMIADGLSYDDWIVDGIAEAIAEVNQIRHPLSKHRCAIFCRTPPDDYKRVEVLGGIRLNIDHQLGLQQDLEVFRNIFDKHADIKLDESSNIDRPSRTNVDGVDFLTSVLKQKFKTTIHRIETPMSMRGDASILYEACLRGVAPADRPIAQILFAWVIAAARSLTVEELTDALRVGPKAQSLESVADERAEAAHKIDLEVELQSLCGGLLEVRQGRTVNFVHPSAKDFVMATSDATNFASRTHAFIAERCLDYFSAADDIHCNRGKDLVPQSPLVNYARQFWIWHSKLAGTSNKRLTAKITRYLEAYIRGMNIESQKIATGRSRDGTEKEEQRTDNWMQHVPDSMLALSAYCGFEAIVEMYLHAGVDPNGHCSACPTPLQLASSQGSAKVVEILLQAGATLTNVSSPWPDSVFIASSQGYHNIVGQLLTSPGPFGDTKRRQAPQTPALKDDTKKTQNHTPRWGHIIHSARWSKNAACSSSHDRIIRHLLDYGADVNEGHALQAACYSGRIHVVKMLVERGADMNVTDSEYGTPLQIAPAQGHQKIVRRLIEVGADVHTGDADRRTPCHPNLDLDHDGGLRRFNLRHTRWVSPEPGLLELPCGQTPIHWAAARGHTRTVKTLIDSRSELVEAMTSDQETPLHLAAAEGHLWTARSLTAAFAASRVARAYGEIKHQEYYRMWCDNEVSAACNNSLFVWDIGSRETAEDEVERLKTQSAVSSYLNMRASSGRTALHIAAANGHADVVQHLLQCGASIETQDCYGYTPLASAAENGHTEAIETLLVAGATIKRDIKDRSSPIRLAAKNEHYHTAELLLFYCFSIEVTGSPLQDPALSLVVQETQSVIHDLLRDTFETNEQPTWASLPLRPHPF